jgi:hypothetical protein
LNSIAVTKSSVNDSMGANGIEYVLECLESLKFLGGWLSRRRRRRQKRKSELLDRGGRAGDYIEPPRGRIRTKSAKSYLRELNLK